MILLYIVAVAVVLGLFAVLALALRAPDGIPLSFMTLSAFFAVLVLPVAGIFWSFDLDYADPREETCTVHGKQEVSVMRAEPTPSLRLNTSCGTLEIEEMMLSDVDNVWPIYYSIDAGKTYKFELSGREHSALGDYTNIVSVVSEVSNG
ncbi:hypothetical protein SEA_LOZINAK_74 [Gordonia phage Lozinak]|uniref:Transmembrane protein n=3 Tax=Smoothievirus smoothie TaxID=1982561 RepID=A0A2D1GG52_9CAUD|nr:secreted protein [Gordonia phage Smoothie]YP_009281229.1 secreted protein [Gordonia phage Cucurbita]ATN90700.1 hypothetical protein SEA_LOZINAK_74 [Gordonia phage Lozinak]AUE23643.1 hypothetical protein SEA_TONIANN_74 [Gordonia phage Toniann]QAU06938.1 hypothetical protein SEA_APHELION_73 [Gordonia phage Aphelion]QKY79651.1 hypothetical protein SEA_ENGINEER_75 [Gordonia Phage Engineer]QYC53558.1 membrane protein [Gordonia phage Norvs]WKW85872.1 membrane protein [Gordonia Phage PhinkBoden]